MDIRGPRHRHLDLSRRERGAFGRGKEERGGNGGRWRRRRRSLLRSSEEKGFRGKAALDSGVRAWRQGGREKKEEAAAAAAEEEEEEED